MLWQANSSIRKNVELPWSFSRHAFSHPSKIIKEVQSKLDFRPSNMLFLESENPGGTLVTEQKMNGYEKRSYASPIFFTRIRITGTLSGREDREAR
jgi:hypothetical protein